MASAIINRHRLAARQSAAAASATAAKNKWRQLSAALRRQAGGNGVNSIVALWRRNKASA